MKMIVFFVSLGLGIAAVAAPAPVSANMACQQDQDCRDTRSRAEREADAAEIRRLNIEQARHVRERDARNAAGWRAYEQQPAQQARFERDRDDYERSRAQYEAEMAEWRRRVRLCRQGYYEYCE